MADSAPSALPSTLNHEETFDSAHSDGDEAEKEETDEKEYLLEEAVNQSSKQNGNSNHTARTMTPTDQDSTSFSSSSSTSSNSIVVSCNCTTCIIQIIQNISTSMTNYKNKILEVFTDQSGSITNILHGLFLMCLLGTILGLCMPKNDELPTVWYRSFSSVIGYIYFVCWSISFYPQVITNYQRQSTAGLSTDATILAIVNYTCYSIYNGFFFWDTNLQPQTKEGDHDVGGGSDGESFVAVQSNDVAFAIHALLINFLLMGQILYYGGSKPSKTTIQISMTVLLFSILYMIGIYVKISPTITFLNFLYLMATIKLLLSIMTYLPQLYLNYTRRSCVGFNLWNPILDCSGGVLSLLQLVLDSMDMNNFRDGVLGNWAKLVLALLTLCFDGAFFIQHYILYPPDEELEDITQNWYTLLDSDGNSGGDDNDTPLSMSIVSV